MASKREQTIEQCKYDRIEAIVFAVIVLISALVFAVLLRKGLYWWAALPFCTGAYSILVLIGTSVGPEAGKPKVGGRKMATKCKQAIEQCKYDEEIIKQCKFARMEKIVYAVIILISGLAFTMLLSMRLYWWAALPFCTGACSILWIIGCYDYTRPDRGSVAFAYLGVLEDEYGVKYIAGANPIELYSNYMQRLKDLSAAWLIVAQDKFSYQLHTLLSKAKRTNLKTYLDDFDKKHDLASLDRMDYEEQYQIYKIWAQGFSESWAPATKEELNEGIASLLSKAKRSNLKTYLDKLYRKHDLASLDRMDYEEQYQIYRKSESLAPATKEELSEGLASLKLKKRKKAESELQGFFYGTVKRQQYIRHKDKLPTYGDLKHYLTSFYSKRGCEYNRVPEALFKQYLHDYLKREKERKEYEKKYEEEQRKRKEDMIRREEAQRKWMESKEYGIEIGVPSGTCKHCGSSPKRPGESEGGGCRHCDQYYLRG